MILSAEAEICLLTSDLNTIKRDIVLCTRNIDCYVRFSSDFCRDAFGNPLPALANSITASPTDYPLLFVETRLDHWWYLEISILEIQFNEFIMLNTFDVTQVSFQDSLAPTTSYNTHRYPNLQFTDTSAQCLLAAQM